MKCFANNKLSMKGRSTKKVWVMIIICFIVQHLYFIGFASAGSIPAEEELPIKQSHLLLVVVPGLSFHELNLFIDALPLTMQDQTTMAGMSMRTGAGTNLLNNIITLSTGHREVGLSDWNAYEQNEEVEGVQARALFQQWSGEKSQAPIVHPHFFKLQKQWNEKGDDLLTGPGWLGTQLVKQGIEAYAFGNSDVRDHRQRMAPSFIMNDKGEVKGNIGKQMLLTDTDFPTGVRTDWNKLSTSIMEIWKTSSSSMVVVELGDLERIYSEKDNMYSYHYAQIMQDWFKEWGTWMGDLATVVQDMDHAQFQMMVVSPMVSPEAMNQGELLAPYMMWNKKHFSGLSTSNSTKQEGIVSNLDILPSILDFFGIEQPKELVGKVIYPVKAPLSSLEEQRFDRGEWLQHVEYLFSIYQNRGEIIKTYILFVIFFLIGATLYWWWNKQGNGAKVIQVIIGAILISPLYFLWLTPLILWLNEWGWITVLFTCSLLTSLLLYMFFSDVLFLGIIGLSNMAVLLFDVWQGSEWMKRSFLGYDPIIGARYYGLGNEYAGILLGSSILGITALYVWFFKLHPTDKKGVEKRKLLFIVLTSGMYLFILYTVAAPHLGTNAGATLAILLTYICSQMILVQYRLRIKWFFILIVLMGVVFLSLGFMHLQTEHTHIGAFIRMVAEGDVSAVTQIISRKWEMNMKLIRVSLWGKLFITSLIVLAVILFRLRKDQLRKFSQDPWFNGFRSIILGAVLILILNDSGIVSAATTIMYMTFPFVYLRFNEIDRVSKT